MSVRYQVVPGVVSTVVDGEVTVLDPRAGVYFGLEDVGARVWQLLAGRPDLETLVRPLLAEFDVTPDTCRDDVRALLDELVERGLVERVEPG